MRKLYWYLVSEALLALQEVANDHPVERDADDGIIVLLSYFSHMVLS